MNEFAFILTISDEEKMNANSKNWSKETLCMMKLPSLSFFLYILQHPLARIIRGGCRISEEGGGSNVERGGRLPNFTQNFLKIPMKMK